VAHSGTVGPDVVLARKQAHQPRSTDRPHFNRFENIFHPHASSARPHRQKNSAGKHRLIIGNRQHIREAVTITSHHHRRRRYPRSATNNLIMSIHIGTIARSAAIASSPQRDARRPRRHRKQRRMSAPRRESLRDIGDSLHRRHGRCHHDVPPFVKLSENDRIRAMNVEASSAPASPPKISSKSTKPAVASSSPRKTLCHRTGRVDTSNGSIPVKLLVEFLHAAIRKTGGTGKPATKKETKVKDGRRQMTNDQAPNPNQ